MVEKIDGQSIISLLHELFVLLLALQTLLPT